MFQVIFFHFKIKFYSSENIVANHYYCLIEWLIHGGSSNILKDPEIADKLCLSIELGLFGKIVENQDLKKEKELKKQDSSLSNISGRNFPKFITKHNLNLSPFLTLKKNPLHSSSIILVRKNFK